MVLDLTPSIELPRFLSIQTNQINSSIKLKLYCHIAHLTSRDKNELPCSRSNFDCVTQSCSRRWPPPCVDVRQDEPEAQPGGPGVLGASHPARPEERGGRPSDRRCITLLGDHLYGYLQKASPESHVQSHTAFPIIMCHFFCVFVFPHDRPHD